MCSPIYAAYFAQLYWDSNRITGNSYKQYLIYFADGDQDSLNTDKVFFSFIQNRTVLNMKNKEFYKLLKKSYSKSNSGFTLTELLVGIIMAGIVVGGLGWGLLQILRVTQVGTSKSKVRSETSRAFTFISDEMRRAQSLEVDPDAARTAINARPGVSIPTDGTAVLALNIPNIPEKVIYYVADAPSDGVWRGPRVIY
ncbi:MAG: prepilin-type N-terminal cleavage/methylation domain-containing protein, partial [Cyanobacteria bacterium J06631_2]